MNSAQENPWATARRYEKLSKLLDAADQLATTRGKHPRRDATELAQFWIDATVEQFAELIARAKVRGPSATTWKLFLEALQHRADVGCS